MVLERTDSNKIALIDLDGPIADGTQIEAEANENFLVKSREWWRHITSPASMERRQLVENAAQDLHNLEREGYRIVYLTSRLKDELEDVTRDWLEKHQLLVETGCSSGSNPFEIPALERPLLMKPHALKYVKGSTPWWKAAAASAVIQFGYYDQVLIIEDDPDNKLAIADSFRAAADAGVLKELRFASSLAEALGRKQPTTGEKEEATEAVAEPDDIPF